MARYYARLKRRLILRGLLRTKGGGPNTPFAKRNLFRDFQTLAVLGEYVSGQGSTNAKVQPANLSKCISPYRVRILVGPSVPAKTLAVDTETIEKFLKRLSHITCQPAYLTEEDGNFDVLTVYEDDRDAMLVSLSRNKATLEPKVQNF